MKVAYLGPAGSFNEEALVASAGGRDYERAPQGTIFDAVNAVESGSVDRALVPFENSIEGAVRSTLDALAFDTERVRLIGEYDHPIRHNLIAATTLDLDQIEVVASHPQANAQCARFIRERLPGAEVRPVASTSDAVRQVAESEAPWAALGSAAAADAYDCRILERGVEDVADNVTRFVWLAREGESTPDGSGDSAARGGETDGAQWRTTIVFSELGDDRPGALVDALMEFSSRSVNLTRIESRPLRRGLGRYLFFIDIDGPLDASATAAAIEALQDKAERVRLLGSYPVGGPPPLTG